MRWKITVIHLAALVALILMASVVVAGSGERASESRSDATPGDGSSDDLRVPWFEVRWFAQAGGGAGSPITAGGWSLSSTLGQVAIGRAGSLPSELCAGFWCARQQYHIYLPLVLKG